MKSNLSKQFLFVIQFSAFLLIFTPSCLTWYWGNLVVYLDSYYYVHTGSVDLSPTWMISVLVVSWSVAFIVAGYFEKWLDLRVFTTIGVILNFAGIFIGHLVVDVSATALSLTLGVVIGFSFGLTQEVIYSGIACIAGTKAGVAFALLKTFSSGGAVLHNAVITWYLNPTNLEANLSVGRIKVFTAKSIIDRVPSVLILLGILTACFLLPGWLLSLFFKVERKPDECETCKEQQVSVIVESASFAKADSVEDVERRSILPPKKADSSRTGGHCNICRLYDGKPHQQDTRPSPQYGDQTEDRQDNDNENKEIAGEGKHCASWDSSQWRILKTSSFYIVWFSFLVNEFSGIIVYNFYKVYGGVYIEDDLFLTNLGNAALIFSGISRILLSLVMDRLPLKTMHALLTALLSFGCLFLYAAPGVDRWLYAALTITANLMVSVIFLTIPLIALSLFGKSNFGFHYSLLTSSCILVNAIFPLTLEAIIARVGLGSLYLSVGVLNALSLLVTVLGLPYTC